MATNAIAIAPRPLGTGYYARVFSKEARYEFVRMLRTRAFSLSVIGFPVMFYLMIGVTNRSAGWGQYLLPTYSCMGVVSACLFGIGVSISLERVQGWLDVKQASPMPRLIYLGAKLMGCAAFAVIIVGLLLLMGITLAGVHVTAWQALDLTGVVLAGSVPFAAMGLLVALLVPANSAPTVINLIYLPMSFASGYWMPIKILPHWLQALAPVLPTYHLGELALNAFGLAQSGSMVMHWEVLFAFTLLMLGAAWFLFTRMEAKA